MTGNFQFFGQTFQPGGNFRNLELSIVLRAAGCRSQQLQIIDDDELDILLCLEPARFGPQFENAEAGAVVDEDFCFRELGRRRGQARKIALTEKSVAHFLQIHTRARAEQTLNQLLTTHF